MRLKIVLLLGVVLSGRLAVGQTFEGEIEYANTFKSNIKGLTDKQLEAFVGSKQQYFIKGGCYKSVTNGQTIVMQLYNNKNNRLYNKSLKSDTLYWFDGSVNTDTVLSHTIKKDAGVILGHPCDAIILKTVTGTTTLYYNKGYLLDVTKYTKHKYGNWAFYTAKAGALPLKMVIENNQFTMESTAIEIRQLQIKDDFFDIDAGTPVKQSVGQ